MTAVAVYTDASISGGRGAWATVILREGHERAETAGPLRGAFKSSTATEIAAVANALHYARRLGLIARGDVVTIWCDNEAAVLRVNGRARNKQRTDSRLIEAGRWIRGFARATDVKLEARHIHGHQRLDTDDRRAIYNQRCDQLCGAIRDGIVCPSFESLELRIEKARARKAAGQGSHVERVLWATEVAA